MSAVPVLHAEKQCRGCKQPKMLAKFAKLCDDCKRGKPEAKKLAEPKVTSKWSRPFGFGFDVELQVDEKKKQTDIAIEQTIDGKTATIWLNQAEARELHSWLTETMGL
jgi:hypothetical protein